MDPVAYSCRRSWCRRSRSKPAAAPNVQGLLGAGLAMLMVAIAATDWRSYVIPDELNIAAFVLALAATGFENGGEAVVAIAGAALRAVLLSLAFLALRYAYRILRQRDGLGLGDVKLAAVAGAWLSWQTIPIVIEIAALFALAAYAAHRYFFRPPLPGHAPVAIWIVLCASHLARLAARNA